MANEGIMETFLVELLFLQYHKSTQRIFVKIEQAINQCRFKLEFCLRNAFLYENTKTIILKKYMQILAIIAIIQSLKAPC